jgi:hypothetical protein
VLRPPADAAVAKYMGTRPDRAPLVGESSSSAMHRTFGLAIFFYVRTVLLGRIHVFSVVRHADGEVIHFDATRHATAHWTAQHILDPAPGTERRHHFSRYGVSFDRRVRQVRTPLRLPRGNAIAEKMGKICPI